MPDKSMISRVIDWLSVGYPKDVPVQDRAAVMAILKMRLTDEQLQEVVRQLMQSRAARGEAYVSDQRINEYIRRVVDHTPTPQDIDRVAKILGAHGFLIAENHVNEDAEPTAGGTEYVPTMIRRPARSVLLSWLLNRLIFRLRTLRLRRITK